MNAHRSTALAALVALGGLLGGAGGALAAVPTGDYAVFDHCPRFSPKVNLCLYARTSAGEATLGRQTAPIVLPIVLQGGIIRDERTEAETFVAVLNGETLTKAPQKLPGGLRSLLECDEIDEPLERAACELVFESGVTAVNATIAFAGPPARSRSAKTTSSTAKAWR